MSPQMLKVQLDGVMGVAKRSEMSELDGRPNIPVSHTTFTIMKTTYHASSVLRCQGSRPRPDMRFPPSAICSLLM